MGCWLIGDTLELLGLKLLESFRVPAILEGCAFPCANSDRDAGLPVLLWLKCPGIRGGELLLWIAELAGAKVGYVGC